MTYRERHVPRVRRGFTLVEAAIAICVIGLGLVALMQLLAAGTMSTAESLQRTTATQLVSEIRERAAAADFDTLATTFDEKTFSPPIDAAGRPMAHLSHWSQKTTAASADPDDLLGAGNGDTRATRITATILFNGAVVHSATWIHFQPSE